MRRIRARHRTGVRLSLLAIALVLGGYAFVNAAPSLLIVESSQMIGSAVVGMSAGVPDNEYNALAEQLKEREEALNAREASFGRDLDTETDPLVIYSFMLSASLFFLLAMNYYYDWRRTRRRGAVQA